MSRRLKVALLFLVVSLGLLSTALVVGSSGKWSPHTGPMDRPAEISLWLFLCSLPAVGASSLASLFFGWKDRRKGVRDGEAPAEQ